MKVAAAMFVVVLIAATMSFGAIRRDDSGDVAKVINAFNNALQKNDADKLIALTSPDYTFITPLGVIESREVRFEPVRAGRLKYSSVEYKDVKIRVYGKSAVVTATVITHATNDGKDVSGQFRSTLTLAKISGKWLIVAAQANRLQ